MVLIRNEEEPEEKNYHEIIRRIMESRAKLNIFLELLGRFLGLVSEYLPGVGTKQPGDGAQSEVVKLAMECITSFSQYYRSWQLVRAFFFEYLPELNNIQTPVSEIDERFEENINSTTTPDTKDDVKTFFDHRIVLVYEKFGRLGKKSELLLDQLDEIRELIEQREQKRRLIRFQRDLDDDRHLGEF